MTVVGRPNVGKSTLVNRILGTRVSIVSERPHTTRTQVRGVLNRPDAQLVFVDTPGLHRPRTPLGERMNQKVAGALGDVDAVVVVLDASQEIGPGDRLVASRAPRDAFVTLNKVDRVPKAAVLPKLAEAVKLDLGECFPVSATTGEGVAALVEALVARMPEGPRYFADDVVTDVPDAFWVAELVREQLLAVTRDEVSHSVACRVSEWEWPRIRCEILVERESQKSIVIGRGGSVLKQVGAAARAQLPPGCYLELFVKVEKDWQRRLDIAERLGY